MEMDERPRKNSLSCPPQVLVLKKKDFPISADSVVIRARQSSVFTRDGKIYWVVLPDNPEEARPLHESALRAAIARENIDAHASKQGS